VDAGTVSDWTTECLALFLRQAHELGQPEYCRNGYVQNTIGSWHLRPSIRSWRDCLDPLFESLFGSLLGAGGLTLVVLVLLAATALYFLPTVVAAARHKRNALAIFLLNLFLGWSGIAWVVALVWAVTIDRHDAF